MSRHIKWQNTVLLLSAYVFYGWWDWRFLLLIVLSSVTDYLAAIKISSSSKKNLQKRWLWLSLLVNLGILAYFKYAGFFVNEFIHLLESLGMQGHSFTLNIILPVGISFYTFQTLSYTIDVYFKRVEVEKNWLNFFCYVSFFPQLVAGPIERAKDLLPQFSKKRIFNNSYASEGLRYILWGLFKKVVVADRLGQAVEVIFNPATTTENGLHTILGSLLFGIQIYCDFSGYSDIAMGTARLFGFELSYNFKAPYLARSLREFWKRWHITLSEWFRDYVYLPLGGYERLSRNILITFIVSGLWHGANWTFLIWGAIHGVGYLIERQTKALFKNRGIKLPVFFSWLGTFVAVMLAWLFFRSENVHQAMEMLLAVFHWEKVYLGNLFPSDNYAYLSILFALFVMLIDYLTKDGDINRVFIGRPSWQRWGYYYVLFFCILIFGEFEAAPQFIYFQF